MKNKLIVITLTSCRRAAAKICPCPGLQRKRAAAALSQAGRSGPAEPDPISQYAPSSRPAAHAARRPDVRDRRQTDIRRQTDRRQTASSLNAPWAGA